MVDYSVGPDFWTAEIEKFGSAGGTTLAVRTDAIADVLGLPHNSFGTVDEHIDVYPWFLTGTPAIEEFHAAMKSSGLETGVSGGARGI